MPIAEAQAVVDRDLNVQSLLDETDAREALWDILREIYANDGVTCSFGRGPHYALGSFTRAMQLNPTQKSRERVRVMRRVTEDMLPAKSKALVQRSRLTLARMEDVLEREQREIWTPQVSYLAGLVSGACGWTPDAVSINIFRDHIDHMAMHIDTPDIFKRFATVSLGASRELWVRPLDAWDEKVVIPMESGDLITMEGEELLGHHVHGVPAVDADGDHHPRFPYEFTSTLDHIPGIRISATFYELVDKDEIPDFQKSLVIAGEVYEGSISVSRFATRDVEAAFKYLESPPEPLFPDCLGPIVVVPAQAISVYEPSAEALLKSYMEVVANQEKWVE